jgi:hypothetical protein
MREPLFCKKAVPAPSAKNSYMAGGKNGALVKADLRVRPANDKQVAGI